MDKPITPKPAERDSSNPVFTPAPNPFDKSTTEPDKMQEQADLDTQVTEPVDAQTAPSDGDGVELIGKRANEKPESGQLPEPKKKSLLKSYFGTSAKKVPAHKEESDKPKSPEQVLMSWQAAEFVQTHKPLGWYLGFAGFFAVLILLAIFTKQYITVGLFAVMGVAIVIFANRPPRTLRYQISNYGVSVGDKKYLYDDFGSYYETNDYGQPVLELVPNKRFGTLVSLPPAEHQIDELEQTLSQMLPKVDNREDFVDKLFRKLRF
jgi:hypothetical protein